MSAAIAARILWRQRDYAAAAEWLASSRVLTQRSWRDTIAPSFGRVFEKADPHETQNAFRALLARKLRPDDLAALARNIGSRGDHKLAFSLLREVPANGADGAGIEIWCFQELKATDGEEAASAWLRRTTKNAHQLLVIAYQLQQWDILWAPLEDPARPSKDDAIQLMRAASLFIAPDPGGRRESVARYFEGRTTEFADYGRLLLGQLPAEQLLRTPKQAAAVASIGWAMALHAASRGRYDEASDWFQVSVLSGQSGVPPTAWSLEALYRWDGKRLFLDGLAKEKAL